MSNLIKGLFFIACFVRVASQRVWEYFDNPFIFYIGVAFFELVALVCVRGFMGNKKMFIDFFIASVLFDIVKYLYFQPYKVTYDEDMGFFIGLIVVILEYVYRNYIKGSSLKGR